MTTKFLFIFIFLTSACTAVYSQEDPGFDVYRASLHRNYQDIDYNGPSALVYGGTFYGLHTFGSYFLGGEIADNVQLGFYFAGSFGMSYSFKGDFGEKELGLNFGVAPGLAAAYTLGRKNVLGMKSYILYDLDRISFSGIVFEPSARFGPIYVQTSLMTALGTSKDQQTESFEAMGMLMMGDRVGLGVRYSVRSAYNGTALNTRSTLNQIHLVFELH